MDKTTWRLIAIIFIILFSVMVIWFTWSYIYVTQQEKLTNICYYEVCEDYPEANYEDHLCSCYDYDMLGNYVLVKTELL